MEIIQSLNQNAVMCLDKSGNKIILTGKGIGFGKKEGDSVNEKLISRIYEIEYTSQQKVILDSIKDVPEDILLITEELLEYMSNILNEEFIPLTNLVFANHLHYAIERSREEKNNHSDIQYEFQHIFPREYKASLAGIHYLREKFNIHINESEVTFFIMHILNGLQKINNIEDVLDIGKIIKDILNVINEMDYYFDENNIFYSRFITHLRYFLMRKFNNVEISSDDFEELYYYLSTKFLSASNIVEKIETMMLEKHSIEIDKSEKMYLTIHIQRLMDETKN